MGNNTKRSLLRTLSLSLALLLGACCSLPARAAQVLGSGVTSTFDEAYYATLDYYGSFTEGSVVKSYIMNGATSITDFGTYDEVRNLTDGTRPALADGTARFQFEENNVPSHFYFEGRTKAPFEALPWTLAITYTLNGVPVRAEELAGQSGVVELRVDAVPNEAASDYAKHNYTLQAMALFNQDDILSLEAPGAQVQLIGNLRAVLFLGLPGEEEHFTIRVGTDSFTFDGMTFMMVPATLGQLEDIAKLGERKGQLEEDYHKLSGSMDQLLSSFSALGGSLRATADGLDQLNDARDTISQGKGVLYEKADLVLGDLDAMTEALNKMPDHLTDADTAVDEVTASLTTVSDAALQLNQALDDLDGCLEDLQYDMARLRVHTGSTESALDKVALDLDRLERSLTGIRASMETMSKPGLLWRQHFSNADSPRAAIDQTDFLCSALVASGKSSDLSEARSSLAAYEAMQSGIAQFRTAAGLDDSIPEDDVLTAMVAASAVTQEQADLYRAMRTQQPLLTQVYTAAGGTATMTKPAFFAGMLMLSELQQDPAHTADILAHKADYIKKASALAELDTSGALAGTSDLMTNMAALLEHMGTGGVTSGLSGILSRTGTTLSHLDETTDTARSILTRTQTILTELDKLDDTVNQHVPGLHSTLADTRDLMAALSGTTAHTSCFLTSFRDLMEKAGGQLDAGAKKTLDNLALTLRRTANSTDAAGGVKTAKDAMGSIIEEAWGEVTGEHNNLLLLDANAKAESLTSDENPTPTSIQVLIRTQEIKEVQDAEAPAAEELPPATTFWGRMTQMFRDFWHFVTGIFHRGQEVA